MPAPEGLDFGDDDYADAQFSADTDLDLQDEGEQIGVSDEGDGGLEEEAPERRYAEVDEDSYVRIKVGGVEKEVPWREALALAQKGEDYTQKTQELAQQRQVIDWANALQAAMAEDFDGTIDVLRPVWAQDQTPRAPTITSDDPIERKLQEIEAWQRQQDQRQAQSTAQSIREQIAREAQAIEGEHGQEFLMEASGLAQQNKWTLTQAAEILEGRKLKAWVQSEKAKADRTDAKRNDSVVSTGGSRRSVEPAAQDYKTLDEALAAAFREVKTRR